MSIYIITHVETENSSKNKCDLMCLKSYFICLNMNCYPKSWLNMHGSKRDEGGSNIFNSCSYSNI